MVHIRADGRAPEELRLVRIEPGFVDFAEGSCLVAFGRTRVVCAATVEQRVPNWMHGSGRGWVTAEYSMLPRSTVERTPREAERGRQSGRTLEIQRLIGRSLRSVIDLDAMGERMVTVDCDCLVADGGTRTASITGGYVALVAALRALVERGELARLPVHDEVAAVSVGVVDGVTYLDLDYLEDSRAEVDMNVVMTGSGRYVELQGTAEGDPFDASTLDDLLGVAARGAARLVEAQRTVLNT